MHVAIRVANYQGNLETLLRERALDFTFLPTGREDVRKYLKTIERDNGTYVVMISGREPQTPDPNYDFIMTVMGPASKEVITYMHQLVDQLGIATRDAPPQISARIHATLDALLKFMASGE